MRETAWGRYQSSQWVSSPKATARGAGSDRNTSCLASGTGTTVLRLPTQPVHFNGALPNRAQRAPALGEHTDALMASLLQCSAERLGELRAAGLFGNALAAA